MYRREGAKYLPRGAEKPVSQLWHFSKALRDFLTFTGAEV